MRTYLQSRWRKESAEIIGKILLEMNGKEEPEIRKALRDAYPFGPRKYHPYKIWLDEIQRQTGKKWPIGHKQAWQNSQKRKSGDYQKIQEWERIYGKRSA